MDTYEKLIFSNSLGTVSNIKVTVNHKNGSENILLKQISTISYDDKRKAPLFIFLYGIVGTTVIFYILFFAKRNGFTSAVEFIIILLLSPPGLIYVYGYHEILINVDGKNRRYRIKMVKAKEALDFVHAVKEQMVD